MVTPIFVHGMHGLGDNLHQRALIRHLLSLVRDVWLETPWPGVYHDLVGTHLHLLPAKSRLRTQAKNECRQVGLFSTAALPPLGPRDDMRVWYSPESVRRQGSVLGAMLNDSGYPGAARDFRLPVPSAWRFAARRFHGWIDKPILIYRPLTERREWAGCRARNPDHAAYAALFADIRDRYFVVSIADLVEGEEWLVGPAVKADLTLHAGELDFESLVGLFSTADVVWSAPGFATILAQAVGTPSVCVFGGYEDGHSFSAGAAFTPHLAVEPIRPCPCFQHNHACDKTIDMAASRVLIRNFDHAVADRRSLSA